MENSTETLTQPYSFDDCLEEAKKYRNKKEWKESGKTYETAFNKNWISDIAERVGFSKNGRGRKWWYKIG